MQYGWIDPMEFPQLRNIESRGRIKFKYKIQNDSKGKGKIHQVETTSNGGMSVAMQ